MYLCDFSTPGAAPYKVPEKVFKISGTPGKPAFWRVFSFWCAVGFREWPALISASFKGRGPFRYRRLSLRPAKLPRLPVPPVARQSPESASTSSSMGAVLTCLCNPTAARAAAQVRETRWPRRPGCPKQLSSDPSLSMGRAGRS